MEFSHNFFAAAWGVHPFGILAITIVFIVVMITVFRVNAFFSLILAAILAGLLSPLGSLPGEPAQSHLIQSVEISTVEFGIACGKIAVVIALAAVIGMCMMESGAADKIVRRFLAAFGEKHAGFALLTSTYIVSMPIFFDTLFMLLVPIAKALRLRTGKDYLLYVLVICGAGVITHSTVAPHPGPLAMADSLKIDLGYSILVSVLIGIIPALWVFWFSNRLNRRYDIPLRESEENISQFKGTMEKPESELPSFIAAISPVILPLLLITFASFFDMFLKGYPGMMSEEFKGLNQYVQFFGNRNVALFIGAACGIGLLIGNKKISFRRAGELMGPPLEIAGMIILITAAGGAFGAMLRNAGVGGAVENLREQFSIHAVVLAWVIAAVLKLAQGSGTVAMLTTAAMMANFLDLNTLEYHPICIFLAIGFGSLALSWMNDSGFWVVCKLSGFTEQETLKTWTVMLSTISILGGILAYLLSLVLPGPAMASLPG